MTAVHSQKKWTDSLLTKKSAFESKPGFTPIDTNYIKVLYELSRSYSYQVPDSTKSISERVIEYSSKIGFEKGIAGGKLGLGLYDILNGEFDKGFKNLDAAENIAKLSGSDTIFLKSINTKAMGQFMKGDYPSAYMSCNRGNTFATQMGNLEMQVFFTMNLATCFSILRDHDRALPYYEKALSLVSETNDKSQRAQIESNLAYTYLHSRDYKKAKSYAQSAIAVLSEEQYQAWESFAWATMGEVAIREKLYEEALTYFDKSYALLMQIQDQQRKAETLQGFAETYYLLGNEKKSVEFVQKAEKISKDIKYYDGILKSSELLYKIATNKGNTEEALSYLKTSKHLSDSLLATENRTKFLMLEAQAKFNQEQELLAFENQKKLGRQKTITYISIILLAALLIIALLIRKNALNQKRTNATLEKLNETKDRLFSIIGHDLKAPIGTLQELLELYEANEISEKEIAHLAPRLKRNVDHSSFTLNNLLYWARTQMNGIKPNFDVLNTQEKASEICDLFSQRIEAKNLKVQNSINPEHKIMADPMHVDIMLRNILSNAIKYSKESGTILISSSNGENKVDIKICDSGVGMDKKTISTILNGDNIKSKPGTSLEKGTGIGLQITKELIESNKGALELTSEPKKGSCVTMSLPAAKL